jgi:predicted nucleic acid-binding protein
VTFVDTSAAARLLVADTGSPEMSALFASPDELFGSTLLVAEVLRVATRHGLAYTNAERVVRRMRLLAMDEPLLREAGRLDLPDAWVRAADAIHLVTATRLGQTEFTTYDRVQARGAEAMGLVVRSPGTEAGWWR